MNSEFAIESQGRVYRLTLELNTYDGNLSIESDERSWRFDVAGWGGLGVSASSDGALVWLARELLLFPRAGQPTVIVRTDEDIFAIFPVMNQIVLVCETSVRLIENDAEVSRVELPDVVLRARRIGTHVCEIDLSDERRAVIEVVKDGLFVVS